MDQIRVSSKGQITLPRQIRRKLHIRGGDRVAVYLEGEQVILRPVTQNLLDLRGAVKVDGGQDFETVRQDVLENRAKKAAGNGS
jgi:AbrB family looped-hinge helix DNA binding protein